MSKAGDSARATEEVSWLTLGDRLRAAREQRLLSLADLEARTKIRGKYLVALESGRREELPARTYARGFVGTVATAVGVDPAEALAVYDSLEPRHDTFAVQPAARIRRPPIAITARTLILCAIVLLLAAAVYWPVRQVQRYVESGLPQAAEGTVTPIRAIGAPPPAYAQGQVQVPIPTTTPTATSTPLPPATATATATPVRGVHLELRLKEDAWLCVIVDARPPERKLATAGSLFKWDGIESIFLRTGNAGGTEITYNGKTEGPAGARGEVKNFQWTAADSPTRFATPAAQMGAFVNSCLQL